METQVAVGPTLFYFKGLPMSHWKSMVSDAIAFAAVLSGTGMRWEISETTTEAERSRASRTVTASREEGNTPRESCFT